MMKVRKVSEAGHVQITKKKRKGVCRVLVGNMKEINQLGRRRGRWEDKIKWILITGD